MRIDESRRSHSYLSALQLRFQVARILEPVRAVAQRPGRGAEAPQGGRANPAPARRPPDPGERRAPGQAALRRAGRAGPQAGAAQATVQRLQRRQQPGGGRPEAPLGQRPLQEKAVRGVGGQGAAQRARTRAPRAARHRALRRLSDERPEPNVELLAKRYDFINN